MPNPDSPLANRHVPVGKMPVTVEGTAARALATGPCFATRHAAVAADVPFPGERLVVEVPLEVHALVLTPGASAYLLPIVEENAVVAAEDTPAILARAYRGTGAAPEQAAQLTGPFQHAPSRDCI